MRWWRRVTTASYGQLWLLPVWGLCLGRGSVAMFKQKAASDPSERVSARTQQCQQSRAAQCRRASPLPRTMPSSGKRNLVVPRCCGQGGSQRLRSPCLHSPYHHGHHLLHITIATVRGEAAPSLSPSDFLRQFSPAGRPQRPLGSWARLLLTLYQTGTRLLHQQQHNTAPFYQTMAKHRGKFKVPRWGQFSFPGMAACKVGVPPLQAQVWGVHVGMTQLY